MLEITGESDLTSALELACRAARAAGEILRENFGKAQKISYKGAIDLVTEVDKAAEARILPLLQQAYPAWRILAEESGPSGGRDSAYRWLVDPLDGTTNYAHGYPFSCVSIALEHRQPAGGKSEILLGVVYDPLREEMFSARKGNGAYLNGRRLRVSATAELGKSLLATGFPYDVRQNPGRSFEVFRRFVLGARAVRRDGSAALDLAYVAAGRFDGFWEEKLAPWDVAAGSILVKEAGGNVTSFEEEFTPYTGRILATNGYIHKVMQETMTPGQREPGSAA